jgi:FixJ family two-component response regulator
MLVEENFMETGPMVAIVDDDPSIRRGLKRLLHAQHWKVQTFASAEEFLERAPGVAVDFALVDIYLPGLNGIELLRRLESAGGGPAVILMTAHGENETADVLLPVRGTLCLRKPFTLKQLLDANGSSARQVGINFLARQSNKWLPRLCLCTVGYSYAPCFSWLH